METKNELIQIGKEFGYIEWNNCFDKNYHKYEKNDEGEIISKDNKPWFMGIVRNVHMDQERINIFAQIQFVNICSEDWRLEEKFNGKTCWLREAREKRYNEYKDWEKNETVLIGVLEDIGKNEKYGVYCGDKNKESKRISYVAPVKPVKIYAKDGSSKNLQWMDITNLTKYPTLYYIHENKRLESEKCRQKRALEAEEITLHNLEEKKQEIEKISDQREKLVLGLRPKLYLGENIIINELQELINEAEEKLVQLQRNSEKLDAEIKEKRTENIKAWEILHKEEAEYGEVKQLIVTHRVTRQNLVIAKQNLVQKREELNEIKREMDTYASKVEFLQRLKSYGFGFIGEKKMAEKKIEKWNGKTMEELINMVKNKVTEQGFYYGDRVVERFIEAMFTNLMIILF